MLYITYFSVIEAGLHIHLISDSSPFSNVTWAESIVLPFDTLGVLSTSSRCVQRALEHSSSDIGINVGVL